MCGLYCLSDVLPVPLRHLTHNLPRGVYNWSGIGSIWTLLSSTNIHLESAVDAEGEEEKEEKEEDGVRDRRNGGRKARG